MRIILALRPVVISLATGAKKADYLYSHTFSYFCLARQIRFTLGVIFTFLLCSCTPPKSTLIGARILWPAAPARPLLEMMGLYYADSSILSPQFPMMPKTFEGSDEITISRASGVVSDNRGRIYVSDLLQSNVLVFDFLSKSVRYLTYDHIFRKPTGMAIDPDGRLYVADVGIKKVLVFDREGNYLSSIGSEKLLQRPMNVAVNASLGRLYVSDARKNVIVVFNLQGEFLFQFGSHGNGDGQLSMPHGIKFDRSGKLYVADMLNARVQVFDPDGGFIASIGDRAPYQLELEYPRDVAFSSDGNLHIIDIKRALMVSCEPSGKLLLVTGAMEHTSHLLGFSSPTGITVSSDDTIYIVDQINNRLTLWKYLGTGPARQYPTK